MGHNDAALYDDYDESTQARYRKLARDGREYLAAQGYVIVPRHRGEIGPYD